MTLTAILMMILILTILWGGFAYMLRIAVKKESEKAAR
ncbi:methionine/alanine import family NSS transporter small subunit [candidate division KSB1 bacterium]|nr:methionine/alanine import family NSS transporter small subunit [candidate division KSB1 bacterium]NIR70476.1 methionine/alanine import family NSS transporter small subunit [candidate division KSB1 bacterium]NIS27654.1 methionine/alanine import family NSS transporter small subunit [candidate division KSB1 bacterium]NIT74489.1 methionine/alanine import family NSS transporter small subunit [candidate division KSB1 bacterium]NIU28335.1 methionine/alanine import family NSS transporter small subun